jgi:hypothetical protein
MFFPAAGYAFAGSSVCWIAGIYKEVYLRAVDMELKGITVYRDKSLPEQTIAACSVKGRECC